MLGYFIIFCILTFPLICHFHTHFFGDTHDGYQAVWNVWWINTAVTELHQSPWHTNYLYYPNGTSLIAQTSHPFNGFFGILLSSFLTLVETYNVIILFCFVMGGLTAFWLAYSITQSYWGSFVAGCIFTFSEYHFMHAEGHTQLVSLEWIPLFVLCWHRLVAAPSIGKAVAAALSLFLVILCDYYYFLFCVLAGIVIVTWYATAKKDALFFWNKKYLSSFGVFTLICCMTSGILACCLLWQNHADPLIGAHDPLKFPLDVLAPFIPGGHWRFFRFTQWYWSRLPGNIHESSVYVGWSVIVLMGYAWWTRRDTHLRCPSFSLWFWLLLFFGVLALGPVLSVAGNPIVTRIMPYNLLQKVFPPIKLSGCPVRMMVMVMLSASVICAIGIQAFFQQKSVQRATIGAVFLAVLFVEFLPRPIPASRDPAPEYVELLKNLPNDGGLVDTTSSKFLALYYQTIHGKPLAGGYISRIPTSVNKDWQILSKAVQEQDYRALGEQFHMRYLLTSSQTPIAASPSKVLLKLLYDSPDVRLYRIELTPAPLASNQKPKS